MRIKWIVALGVVVMASSPAFAEGKKEIQKQIEATSKVVSDGCGCKVQFSYSKKLDFTKENGSSLGLNVRKTIEDVGPAAVKWCKQGDDFKEKFCGLVKAVEVDEDKTASSPYSTAAGSGVIRSYLSTKNPNVISYDGSWVEHFLQTGKMRDRKPAD